MNYSIRIYNEKLDGLDVITLLRQEGYDVGLDEIRGLGIVAVEDKTGKIIGFIWALTGFSSVVYCDYLVTANDVLNRIDIALDMSIALFGILKKCPVKKIILSAQNSKIFEALKIAGFDDLMDHRMMVGDVGIITQNMQSLFMKGSKNGKQNSSADNIT